MELESNEGLNFREHCYFQEYIFHEIKVHFRAKAKNVSHIIFIALFSTVCLTDLDTLNLAQQLWFRLEQILANDQAAFKMVKNGFKKIILLLLPRLSLNF